MEKTSVMLLYLSIFTILLSLILLYNNWYVNRNAIYLALFLIIVSLYGITHYFVVYGKSAFWLALFYNHFTPLMLLVGPLLFFYVRGTLNDSTHLKKTDALHCIPALIQLIGILPYTFQPFSEKLRIAATIIANVDAITHINSNYFYNAAINFIIRPAFLLIYILCCMYMIWRRFSIQKLDSNTPKRQLLISYRWLTILLISLFFIVIEFLIITYNSIQFKPSIGLINSYPLYLLSGAAYCLMPFSLLLFPNVLYGIPIRVKKPKSKKSKNTPKALPSTAVGTSTSEEDPFFELAEKIKKYLAKEKPFLKVDFSISDIALALQVPQNHVSYCINTVMQTKFAALKSDLRINYAVELFSGDLKESFTIEGIAQQSGFKTRASFYNAFKEKTGVTPTEYIAAKQLLQN